MIDPGGRQVGLSRQSLSPLELISGAENGHFGVVERNYRKDQRQTGDAMEEKDRQTLDILVNLELYLFN